ncbi:uncharacterized protein [Musca autumnalis]|uniref:uncharacterized protein n=1 Tax=Musca autumnalis TaxID=221902 RepID=UPI003CE6AF85
MDVKARRGADIDSDHQLLVGTFSLRPAAIKKKKATSKYNIARLQNQATSEAYNLALRSNIGDVNNIATSWESIAQACKQSAQTILGQAVERRKPWISESTWSEITNRKILKNRMEVARTPSEKAAVKAEYKRSAANVKQLTRIDREIYYNNIADEAERASNVGNMRQVYAIKKLGGNNIRSTATIKDKHGADLTTPTEQLNRWREFFVENQATLPHNEHTARSTLSRRNPRRDISTQPPTSDEIKSALESLRNGKSSGPDDIPAELLKYGSPILAEALTPIIRNAWVSEQILNSWKKV